MNNVYYSSSRLERPSCEWVKVLTEEVKWRSKGGSKEQGRCERGGEWIKMRGVEYKKAKQKRVG